MVAQRRYRILIVEPDALVRQKLMSHFAEHSYLISQVESSTQMEHTLAHFAADLVIVALTLPDGNGLSVVRELRARSEVGIMLMMKPADSANKVIGLELGADDCIIEPFAARELQARVANLLWRVSLAQRQGAGERRRLELVHQICRFGDWVFDITSRSLTRKGVAIRLTKAEYELLATLSSHPNQIFSRQKILAMLSHRVETPNDRTIDVLIRRLRSKIERDPKNPQLFITVHGEGYMFAVS